MTATTLSSALIGYAPLVDHKRNALATRVRIRMNAAATTGFDQVYRELSAICPEDAPALMVSVEGLQVTPALLEVPALPRPQGVAAKFMPGEMLMVQTHYVNASTQVSPYKGRVGINFHKYAGSAAPQELGTLFATQQSIRICRSNPTPTFTGSCSFASTATVTITAINGHFHSRGRDFGVYSWDGISTAAPVDADRIYTSHQWEDPPMDRGLSIESSHGAGIKWSCSYQWEEPEGGCAAVDARDKNTPEEQKDCCFTFGPVVEASEHCNVFLYYYPRVERTDIACF